MGPYYRSVNIWKNSKNQNLIWKEVAQHARENGYLSDAVAYPIDEWSMKYLDEINRIGEW